MWGRASRRLSTAPWPLATATSSAAPSTSSAACCSVGPARRRSAATGCRPLQLATRAASTLYTDDARAKLSHYVHTPGAGRPRTVTLLPGEGIGPELCDAVRQVFDTVRAPIQWDIIPNKECIGPDGSPTPRMLDSLKRNRVGLKGVFLTRLGREGNRSTNVQLRQNLDLFAHIVHAYTIAGVNTRHSNINLSVIRQNTEGEYSGVEHQVVEGVVESLKVVSKRECMRIAEYAFEFAYLNDRKKVHAVHKANIMKKADGLFLDCTRAVAKNYPQITYDEIIIDNCAMQLVSQPDQFDVMVMPNLYGNIVGNIASGLTGGPGLTSGANVGDQCVIFEQGTRHVGLDIAGRGIANPSAFLLSAVMMLRHLSLPSFADRIEDAIHHVIVKGACNTRDLGGKSSTQEFVDEITKHLTTTGNIPISQRPLAPSPEVVVV